MLHPPLDAEYQALLLEPHISHNSRLLNSALALGSQGTFPSREQGGLGMHEQYAAFLSLFGKSYLAALTMGAAHLTTTSSLPKSSMPTKRGTMRRTLCCTSVNTLTAIIPF